MSAEPADNQVRVTWPFEMETPQVVNQFVIQNAAPLQDGTRDDTVYLMVGHFSPPVVADDKDARRYLQATGGTLSITPRGSYAMSVARLRELHNMIGAHLAGIGDSATSESAEG